MGGLAGTLHPAKSTTATGGCRGLCEAAAPLPEEGGEALAALGEAVAGWRRQNKVIGPAGARNQAHGLLQHTDGGVDLRPLRAQPQEALDGFVAPRSLRGSGEAARGWRSSVGGDTATKETQSLLAHSLVSAMFVTVTLSPPHPTVVLVVVLSPPSFLACALLSIVPPS